MNFKLLFGSVIRTALAAAGGALVAKGVLDQETANQAAGEIASATTEIVAGAVVYLASQGWSLFQKFKPKF